MYYLLPSSVQLVSSRTKDSRILKTPPKLDLIFMHATNANTQTCPKIILVWHYQHDNNQKRKQKKWINRVTFYCIIYSAKRIMLKLSNGKHFTEEKHRFSTFGARQTKLKINWNSIGFCRYMYRSQLNTKFKNSSSARMRWKLRIHFTVLYVITRDTRTERERRNLNSSEW